MRSSPSTVSPLMIMQIVKIKDGSNLILSELEQVELCSQPSTSNETPWNHIFAAKDLR